MPECQNCGSFVTEAYVRVFAPEERENPRVCPNCENLVRDGATVREARAKRT
jgi:NAD-dependent SIR2 family protein deacetylase